MDVTAREPVLVDFALQGRGSHGAFTWRMLDRLIEEPWLRIEAIAGTSASAMRLMPIAIAMSILPGASPAGRSG
jgi:NTE family protein